MSDTVLESEGVCPVCETSTRFVARDAWLRDHFECLTCRSVPRERALIATLNMFFPDWRAMAIHEAAPALRASAKLARECPGYVSSHYDRSVPFGSLRDGHRSEDLENQTFPDEQFDLVITQDIFEHLFRPDRAIAEIARTLKPGGAHVCTVPIGRRTEPSIRRARLNAEGRVEHLLPPIYHGNPIDEAGSLVTIDYGYDITEHLDRHSGLSTTLVWMDDLSRGIRAEFIEVLVSRKRAGPHPLDQVDWGPPQSPDARRRPLHSPGERLLHHGVRRLKGLLRRA